MDQGISRFFKKESAHRVYLEFRKKNTHANEKCNGPYEKKEKESTRNLRVKEMIA